MPQRSTQGTRQDDPLRAMRGVGRELWQRVGGGDEFVASLRQEEDEPASAGAPVDTPRGPALQGDLEERVWQRVVAHQGETFRTRRGVEIRHQVRGALLHFFRADGARINQTSSRTQFAQALMLCPLPGVTPALRRLRNPSYLYALLNDPRIRGVDW